MRRLLVLVCSILLIGSTGPASAVERSKVQVRITTDLQKLGRMSRKRQLPVLLVFSAAHCPYCELLETEILKPMLISGDYTNKVIIRKLMTGSGDTITDFSGNKVAADSFMTRHGVYVTPTILFLGPEGKELARRLIGINTVEMFGGDVDNAIDYSLRALKARLKSPAKKLVRK
jgi:thioredoxin-related protein